MVGCSAAEHAPRDVPCSSVFGRLAVLVERDHLILSVISLLCPRTRRAMGIISQQRPGFFEALQIKKGMGELHVRGRLSPCLGPGTWTASMQMSEHVVAAPSLSHSRRVAASIDAPKHTHLSA